MLPLSASPPEILKKISIERLSVIAARLDFASLHLGVASSHMFSLRSVTGSKLPLLHLRENALNT